MKQVYDVSCKCLIFSANRRQVLIDHAVYLQHIGLPFMKEIRIFVYRNLSFVNRLVPPICFDLRLNFRQLAVAESKSARPNQQTRQRDEVLSALVYVMYPLAFGLPATVPWRPSAYWTWRLQLSKWFGRQVKIWMTMHGAMCMHPLWTRPESGPEQLLYIFMMELKSQRMEVRSSLQNH